MKGRIWTVPNQITLLRLGFLPFFLILISYERYKWALLVLVVAGLSDGIDGLLARSLNQRSSLGAYLDPIADKLLLSSSFIILAFKKQIAWWLTIIVFSRDILILVVAIVIFADLRVSAVSSQHFRQADDCFSNHSSIHYCFFSGVSGLSSLRRSSICSFMA